MFALIKQFMGHILSYKPEKLPKAGYVFLDMSGTSEDNAALVKEIHAMKSDYNITLVMCPDKKSQQNMERIKEMGVDHMIHHIYNPGTVNDEYPDNHTSGFTKNHHTYWENIMLDGEKISPADIFLIDNQQIMCKALTDAGGTAHYFTDPKYADYDHTKHDMTRKNAYAIDQLTNWLDLRVAA